MKKILAAAIILFTFVLLGGCGPQGNKSVAITSENPAASKESEPAAPVTKKRVALVMKTLTNPFFIEMEKGARKAEDELGIELIVKTGSKETSIEHQVSIIEELISDKVDAIVIAPADSVKLVPVLKKAKDAGIPIVNIDNRLDSKMMEKAELKDIPFISVDNFTAAYKAAQYLSQKIKSPVKAAVIEGIRGADNAEQRKNGVLKAFAENSNITIAAKETANWKIDEASDVTEKILKKTPDIKLIFCANDMMALGVLNYLNKSGKKDIIVGGYDAIPEALDAVKKGTLAVTVNQQADLQGYAGVSSAVKLINKESVEKEVLVDVKIITP